MNKFLNEIIEWKNFELLIDSNIFNKDIVLKAAYQFLDKGYFYFKFDENKNIILQFTKKEDIDLESRDIINEFSDELLSVYLRDRLEKENKIIREAIVTKAINWPLDTNNFVTLDTDTLNNTEKNQLDFDKDIDDILKEIENDPELQIDEEEIERILKEIEEESNSFDKQEPSIDLDAINDIKNKFKK